MNIEEQEIINAAQAFVDANPTYRKSDQLSSRMLEHIEDNQLNKSDVDSWQKAYDPRLSERAYDAGGFREDGTRAVYFDHEAIDRMPADQMKERLRDPIFARGVNLLLENER